MKIRPVGAELLHADRRMDGRTDGERNGRDEANYRSALFWEHTKNENSYKRLVVQFTFLIAHLLLKSGAKLFLLSPESNSD